jgi:MFS family permease
MYKNKTGSIAINVSFFSFLVIASGGIACVASGILSEYFGAKRVATLLLTASCCCCLLSPFFLMQNSYAIFLSFLFFWGMVVVGDSPLFSTLVAQNAPDESKGTLLTIVNCIGFSITIISIQTANLFSTLIEARYLYMILAIGPILGIWALTSKRGFKPPANI